LLLCVLQFFRYLVGCAMDRIRRLSAHLCTGQASNLQPVALILGAGAGVGQGVAKKFAAEGYHVVVVRRGEGKDRLLSAESQSKDKLEEFASTVCQAGGSATALFADCTVPAEVSALVQQVEQSIGPIHFINYNIGAQVGDRTLEATSYRVFELALRLGVVGAFAVAKEAAKYMVPRGYGTIVYTSATAAMRGREKQHAHTAAMSARRMLTQSLAAELGPKGIHIIHVNIDGLINAPETVGEFMKRASGSEDAFNEMVKRLQATREIVEPSGVADTYFHLHNQPKGVWTQELDVKPWTTKAWFSNSENKATGAFRKKDT